VKKKAGKAPAISTIVTRFFFMAVPLCNSLTGDRNDIYCTSPIETREIFAEEHGRLHAIG